MTSHFVEVNRGSDGWLEYYKTGKARGKTKWHLRPRHPKQLKGQILLPGVLPNSHPFTHKTDLS
jgi:hypothetical protein